MHFNLPSNVSEIIRRLEQAGFEAYAVGGCVRDMLLGQIPKDWDITTSAAPEQVKELFFRTVDTGIKHGTVTVLMGGEGYEVTTYRIDGRYEDSRHPSEVTFTKSLREDLLRRDFTINAMAYNETTGIVDCFGGVKDLEAGLIRCVGNAHERFSEDALRILRAYRFAARFGFAIVDETRKAAGELAPGLVNISRERIREEISKILVSGNPAELLTMYDDGILRFSVPLISDYFADATVAAYVLRSIRNTLETADMPSRDGYAYAWGVLCGAAGVERIRSEADTFMSSLNAGTEEEALRLYTRRVLNDLKYDNDTIRLASGLAAAVELSPVPDKPEIRRLMSRMGERVYSLWLIFLGGQGITSPDEGRIAVNREILRLSGEIAKNGDCLTLKQLAVTGSDIKALGISNGVLIGKCLEYLLDRVLEVPALNRREALLELAGEFFADEEQS